MTSANRGRLNNESTYSPLLQNFIVIASLLMFAGGGDIMAFELKSNAFGQNSPISAKYTCEGEDVSPPLSWDDSPQEVKSFALINDDPDAPGGNWVHWVIYDIPPEVSELAEGIPPEEELERGLKQGINDFRRIGYGGPCPPPGKPHRYFFKLYALDTVLNLKPGATKEELLSAMGGHILAETQLIGIYQRY